MAVLVIADHDNQHVRDNTHKTVTAALKLSGDVDVLVAGKDAAAAAAHAAKITGVRKVLLAESDALGEGIAEAFQALVVPLMANYDAVLTPATSQGKNLSPRIAAKLDVAQISEITDVVDASTFTRPIYAGNAIQTVQAGAGKKVITVRTTAFKAPEGSGSAPVESVAAAANPGLSEYVKDELDGLKNRVLGKELGLNLYSWDLLWDGAEMIPGGILDAGYPAAGPTALPGTYTFKLTVDCRPTTNTSHAVPLLQYSNR